MNPSTAFARVLVDELVRCGVREAVLAPGSRNAPLSFALHDADAAGRLRLHVRIDERSASFLALGLAKATGRPVVVTCTSGTAAANLHPAVLEASESGVPLLVLTADRPPELRGAGANQTVDQVKLFGSAVRWYAEAGTPTAEDDHAYWRTLVDRAVAAASGTLSAEPGPVHLNLPLREPLVPDAGAVPDGRPGGAPWTTVRPPVREAAPLSGAPARTVVVAGDCPPELGGSVDALAEAAGWPVFAEPSSGARAGAHAVTTYPLLLPDVLDALSPDRVLVVGRPTLTRGVQALLRRPDVAVEVRAAGPRWADPGRHASEVAVGLPLHVTDPQPDAAWLRVWLEVEEAARAALDAHLDAETVLTGARLARDLCRCLPAGALLLLGSSTPVRDVDLAAGDLGALRVMANRGVAGIDGTVSTAIGAALAHEGPAYALLGDLTLLHDANGLVLGPDEPRPDLCLVVNDNDGGGIFGLLEQGGPEHAAAFERVFGTPHGTDVEALCRATGTAYTRVERADALAPALQPGPGLRVVHVPTDRSDAAARARALREAVVAAARSALPR